MLHTAPVGQSLLTYRRCSVALLPRNGGSSATMRDGCRGNGERTSRSTPRVFWKSRTTRLFGALYGVGLILARRAGRKTAIPFGPFPIAGAFVGVLLGSRAL
jgi:hypothetical protein